jgi:hypothetical protein
MVVDDDFSGVGIRVYAAIAQIFAGDERLLSGKPKRSAA